MTTTTRHTPIKQPDGTYCYSGPNCRRHGNQNKTVKLQNQISSLLEPIDEEDSEQNYYYKNTLNQLREVGFVGIPITSQTKITKQHPNLVHIAGDNHHSLYVETRSSFNDSSRKAFDVWLVEDKSDTPVGFLRFLAGREDYYGKPTIGDIEIRKEYRGKQLGLFFIQQASDKLINAPLHTSGHYTPEGYRSLHGKIPLNESGEYELKSYEQNAEYWKSQHESSTEEYPLHSPIGQTFNSMAFVENWENLLPKH